MQNDVMAMQVYLYDTLEAAPLVMSTSLLLALSLFVAPAAAERNPLLHEQYTLSNGLRVVLHEDHHMPFISVRLVYHVGTLNDPPGKAGVTRLLEHVMFGGSTHVEEGEHERMLWRSGASNINAYTAPTVTVYVSDIPANRLDLVLWLEAERMGYFNARVQRRTIADERRIIVQEMAQRRRGGDQDVIVSTLFDLLHDEAHPLRTQDAESLARIEMDDVATMAEHHYGPRNATLIVAGALPEDVRPKLEKYFAGLSGGERPRSRRALPTLDRTREERVRSARAETPSVWIAWPAPAFGEPGSAEAAVLEKVLDAKTDALLPETSSIAYVSWTHIENAAESMFIAVVSGRPDSDAAVLLTEFDALLTTIGSGALTELDVAHGRRRVVVELHARLDSVDRRAELMADYLGYEKTVDWFTEDVARHTRTTRAGLLDFVRGKLRGRPRAIVYVSPEAAPR